MRGRCRDNGKRARKKEKRRERSEDSTSRGKQKVLGNEKRIVRSLDKRDPTTDRSTWQRSTTGTRWQTFHWRIRPIANCRIGATWIRIRSEVPRYDAAMQGRIASFVIGLRNGRGIGEGAAGDVLVRLTMWARQVGRICGDRSNLDGALET